jgi:phosphatidylinositol-3-phosphatase
VSPYTSPGTRSATYFNHYSLLRTTEELLGLPLLGAAGTSPSMQNDFGL